MLRFDLRGKVNALARYIEQEASKTGTLRFESGFNK